MGDSSGRLGHLMRLFHGVCRLCDLLARGVPEREVRAAVVRGDLVRVRKGLYALPNADPVFVAARRTRSLLTCASAADFYGLWTLPASNRQPKSFHLFRRTGAEPPTAVIHRDTWVPSDPYAPVLGLADVVLHAVRCLPELEALLIAESAMRQGLSMDFIRERLPGNRNAPARAVLDLVDSGSESPIETLARVHLRRAGFLVETQVEIEGVGWVDSLVGGWLILELDGKSHEERAQREKDRRRDRAAQLRGHPVFRYSYADVVHRPEAFVAEVARMLGFPTGIAVRNG
ncbi:type IV toxin-antitoxin system AbiEi family antitoxin domain-containing protein [Sinomonas terrae]|uniref:Type IV toxin-antitoxin system AbiEi family antitoxin domain-containing protein n=1 Tax=Sinomonas terrae TaxID=2908838 RepID=A0ABS9U5U2_9MICC|nr:type IV toxin-antitoxin system AbiEi family antitoxin domain-containing protein [Sinomonas terrae]MCH6471902.1 type IV toxin-antitoxin system AbiEi family antitoxin domain-containing protein [Sinomonas terrae]